MSKLPCRNPATRINTLLEICRPIPDIRISRISAGYQMYIKRISKEIDQISSKCLRQMFNINISAWRNGFLTGKTWFGYFLKPKGGRGERTRAIIFLHPTHSSKKVRSAVFRSLFALGAILAVTAAPSRGQSFAQKQRANLNKKI